jgi:hypothetical protein
MATCYEEDEKVQEYFEICEIKFIQQMLEILKADSLTMKNSLWIRYLANNLKENFISTDIDYHYELDTDIILLDDMKTVTVDCHCDNCNEDSKLDSTILKICVDISNMSHLSDLMLHVSSSYKVKCKVCLKNYKLVSFNYGKFLIIEPVNLSLELGRIILRT